MLFGGSIILDAVLIFKAVSGNPLASAGGLLRLAGLHCERRWRCRVLSGALMLAIAAQDEDGAYWVLVALCTPLFPPTGSDTRPRPFRNEGASCYVNAILQAVYGIAAVREQCRDRFHGFHEDEKKMVERIDRRQKKSLDLPSASREGKLDGDVLLAATWHSSSVAASASYACPHLFLRTCFWQAGQHQDSHEFFFGKILDSEVCAAPQTSRLFRGVCPSTLVCPECSSRTIVSRTQDGHFTSLEIPIHNGDIELLTVQECVDDYFKSETVDKDYEWQGCLQCRARAGRPRKKLTMTVFPEILSLKLNRWSAGGCHLRHKVEASREILVETVEYILQSVVVHRGSANFGHYWAVVRHEVREDMKWYVYNDTIRKEASERDLKQPHDMCGEGQIYILLYTLKSGRRDMGRPVQQDTGTGASSSGGGETIHKQRSEGVPREPSLLNASNGEIKDGLDSSSKVCQTAEASYANSTDQSNRVEGEVGQPVACFIVPQTG